MLIGSRTQVEPTLTWATASSLHEFAWLTWVWLGGAGPAHPVYGEAPGPEIADIAGDLRTLNRYGVVTTFAQGGVSIDPEGGYGQRAVLGAFAAKDVARRLAAITLRADVLVFPYEPGGTGGCRIPVTIDDFHPVEWAGASWGEEELEAFGAVCSREGLKALKSAWRVVAIDPKWGRKACLWQELRHAANPEAVQGPYSVSPSRALGLDADIVR